MKIYFERTGGFAGIRMAATVNTESLSPEQARELRDTLDAAAFFDLPARIESPALEADRFRYKLTVEAEGRRHTVEVGEAAVPEALRPLLQHLMAAARSASRQ